MSTNSNRTAIAATKPAAGYIGGKRNLAGRIVPIIDQTDHDGYAEPFVGMGGIFLRRRQRPKAEFINDISGDVVNFFRVVREHYTVLMDHMRWLMASRAEFQRQQALPAEHLTDIQRAARFLYLQRLAFGGKVTGRSYGVDSSSAARFNVLRLERDLADLHDRLCGVVIEQLGYAEFIRRYDRPGMLFYLDPPYWGCEDDYGVEVFSRDDFTRLAAQLGAIRGKFILSLNDTLGVRECFAQFRMGTADTTYTVGGGAASKRVSEVLISNYALD